MRLLAISDAYIPCRFMQQGLQSLEPLGVEVEVRHWEHDTLIELQQANLAIEQGGPDAVPLPGELTRDVDLFDMLVVQFAPVGRRLLAEMPALKIIGVLRGGTENVDVAHATERRIAVLNTPGRNARAVAECTIGLMLSEVRNIARSHAMLKEGRWTREFPNSRAIPELNEKTVGLIGYGAVGQLVAHYLRAFGSRILAFDPYFQGDPAGAELVELPVLLGQSDIVSLHARLTDETHHLIGRDELTLMKETAILVNTARSALVDESALLDALSRKSIMGAAIDVFDHEPIPADHPLLRLDNVTITPHLAGSTMDAFRNSPQLMAGHLKRLLAGDQQLPLVNSVSPALPCE